MNESLFVILLLISYIYSYDVSINDIRFVQSNQTSKPNESAIALKAAQEARSAQELQQQAGQQASRQIMEQLAERAILAAQSADAAIAGKELVVNELENELHEAREIEKKEIANIEHYRGFMNAAIEAAHQSDALLKLLAQSVEVANSDALNSLTAAKGAHHEIAEKKELLMELKNHKQRLSQSLNFAKEDMESAKKLVASNASAAHSAIEYIRKYRRSKRKNIRYIRLNT